MMKRILAALTASAMLLAQPYPVSAAEDVFFDDFSGGRLNTDVWLIAEKNWGGTVTEDGRTVDYNGGVRAENVSVSGGDLILTGHGNRYGGNLRGINRDGSLRADGKRCGAAIATKQYFASGSYEIRAKIAPELGCCSAMWTFEYEEDDSDGALRIINHEIDIEFPGRDDADAYSLSHALYTTWETEEDYMTSSVFCGDQADGAFHTYRFDWHTGSETEIPRVEFYFDGELTHTETAHIPTRAGRFWLGLWFPRYWAGTPDFDTAAFAVDYVRITPFHEPGDVPQNETYPDDGWAEPPVTLPRGWVLRHSYTRYADGDSRLFLHAPDGTVQEITGDFVHAMNGSFGTRPDQFVFMAIDPAADEWDIFLSDAGSITNLTKNSGYRNEDPRLSPDGTKIVFKSGVYSRVTADFTYNLMLLDLQTGAYTPLTDDGAEKAMPCFSADGRSVYFARYTDHIGAICRMDLDTRETETVFSEPGVTAYYPVVSGNRLYFTKWYSAENHCDQIMCLDGAQITAIPFNAADFDCSDACPAGSGMIYSSTQAGDYDLYYFDGERSVRLDAMCSEKNDLGAAFFPADVQGDLNADGVCSTADAVLLRKWLLGIPDTALADWRAGDLDGSGSLNAADLTLLKRLLLK